MVLFLISCALVRVLTIYRIFVFLMAIVLGETGLGKSTLMDSLFNTNFESSPSPHTLPTVKLKAHTYELQESNVRLKVSLSLQLWVIG